METATQTTTKPRRSRSRTKVGATPRLLVSGDAARRLDAARAWLAAYPADTEILLLAPHRTATDDFLRDEVDRAGARFGLVRSSLDRLAANLATPRLAATGRSPATGFSLIALAARATHALLDAGELSYFEPVAGRPGFAHALARTLGEVRMNRVPLDSVRKLPRAGEELARLVARAAEELDETALADRAAIFEEAIEAAGGTSPPHPVGLPVLLLDVAVSSALEAELVGRIVARAPAALATAASGDDATVRLLGEVLAAKPDTVEPTGDASLVTLKRHLFEDSAPDVTKLDDTVCVRHLPGEARECVEIARSIQKEAEWGTPFDRMAILLRSGTEYRPFVEEALRRAAIPAHFARGTTRPDPAGRALLALLACAAEDLSARRFAEYLSLAQVPDPGASPDEGEAWRPPDDDLLPLGDGIESEREPDDVQDLVDDPESAAVVGGTLRAPWRWEQLLVDAAVIGGRGRWEKRLRGLEAELRLRHRHALDEEESRAAAIARELGDLEHLREFALPLVDRLAALPATATWGEWLDHLRELALRALRDPGTVLSVLSELAPMQPVGSVDLDEVRLILEPRLRELTDPPARSRYGAVFVGPTDAARGMEFDVVFVPGLAEKLFPRRIPEDPILLDDERDELGIPELARQSDRVAGERLALRLSVGAARRRVWLSWPRVDVEKARPRVPSFYGLEIHRAARGVLPGFDELAARASSGGGERLGWPAPNRPDEAIDEAEYDLAVLAQFVGKDTRDATGAAHYLLSANPHLGRALRARARRWLRRWTPADGLVDPEGIVREALARHQMSARSFSPTALQHFAICPYRFFLQAILRLQPREEPAAVEALDPLTKGGLFHEVQFEVLTTLEKENQLPVRPEHLDDVLPVVDAKLDEVANRYAEELVPAIPRVWDDEVNAIRADLREWLRRSAEAGDDWVPHRFELSFGIADRHRPQADPTSLPESVETVAPLRLRGAIDLVERHSERGVLRATDHKTGKARAARDVVVGGGQVLQPVLYALALEKLLGEPVESGRLYYCTADGEYEERTVPLDERSRSAAREVVCTVDHALADGFLPAAPAENACDWCDYRTVCGPYEPIRTAHKPKNRLTDLRRLRAMP